jgi:hypothetical protein
MDTASGFDHWVAIGLPGVFFGPLKLPIEALQRLDRELRALLEEL